MSTHKIKVFYKIYSDNTISPLLTDADNARLELINSNKAKKEYIISHTILNSLLANELNISTGELDYVINKYGKPFLADNLFSINNLYFSLSHSHQGVAVALSTDYEIGIDFEERERRKIEACQRLAQRFYNRRELLYLKSLTGSPVEYRNEFYKIWTLKEALLKARGTGINTTLSKILFDITGEKPICHTEDSTAGCDYSFYSAEIANYTLALACKCRNDLQVSINEYYD